MPFCHGILLTSRLLWYFHHKQTSTGDVLHQNAWPPYVTGMIIGSLHMPLMLGIGEALGGSSSFLVMLAQLMVGPLRGLSPAIMKFKWGFKRWWQVCKLHFHIWCGSILIYLLLMMLDPSLINLIIRHIRRYLSVICVVSIFNNCPCVHFCCEDFLCWGHHSRRLFVCRHVWYLGYNHWGHEGSCILWRAAYVPGLPHSCWLHKVRGHFMNNGKYIL